MAAHIPATVTGPVVQVHHVTRSEASVHAKLTQREGDVTLAQNLHMDSENPMPMVRILYVCLTGVRGGGGN